MESKQESAQGGQATEQEERENTNKLFKKKKGKRKKVIIWSIVAIVFILIGFAIFSASRQAEVIEYTTEKVQMGNLVQTVTATGAVESSQNIDLNFKLAGKLVYLSVDEGSKVRKGRVLARINSSAISAQADQYRANLEATRADLEKIKAGASSEDIKITEERVAKEQNDLKNLKLEQTTELNTLREKALNSLNNASFTASVSLGVVYNNLINDNTTTNLRVSDTGLQINLVSSYLLIQEQLTVANLAVDDANSEQINEAIIWASDQLREVLAGLNIWLNNAYDLSDAIIVNSTYPQATKDSIKTDVSTQQSTNNTSLTSLQTSKSNLVNSVNTYATKIQAAQNDLNIVMAELGLKKADPRDFEIHLAEAKVAQAQAQLNKILADWSDYAIVAPIDGTVTKVNFSIGEQTSLAGSVIEMLSTEKFEVTVDIPESDIAKIKVGDKTIIELDAFGSDHLFKGNIAFIDPAQTVLSDVIYYRTTVSFDNDSFIEQIKPGMTSDVIITTASKDDVLYIPQRVVKIREAMLGEVADKFVEVLVDVENSVVEDRIITVGLRADNGLVEVTSGLADGENVVVFKKNGK